MHVTKKQLFIMYFTMLLLILFSNIFGYSNKNYKPKYGITTANVNFRKSANINKTNIIKVVKKNSKVKLLGEISNFYITQLENNQVGLISKDYVKISGNNLNKALVYTNYTSAYYTLNANNVNVRGGPGTNFKSYTKLKKNSKVQVIGKISNFNMIVTPDNLVGMVRSDFLSKSNIQGNNNTNNSTSSNTTKNDDVSNILNMINSFRKGNNLPELINDPTLTNIAKLKAQDMVDTNYFSHNSQKYGSPFIMMKNFGISYKRAGENIAGNPSIKNAVDSWIASTTHNKNLLSPYYNYIGVGIAKSSTYGYIIVVMFIEK